jgi:hypothetical protein
MIRSLRWMQTWRHDATIYRRAVKCMVCPWIISVFLARARTARNVSFDPALRVIVRLVEEPDGTRALKLAHKVVDEEEPTTSAFT